MDITDRKRAEEQLAVQSAVKGRQAELAALMRGDPCTSELCRVVVTYLGRSLEAASGLIFLADEDGVLRPAAGYAHGLPEQASMEYRPGQGLVGQAALENKEIRFDRVPEDYFRIRSGLGEAAPSHILIRPISNDGRVEAVVELGALNPFSESDSQMLDALSDGIAFALASARARATRSRLLEEARCLTEELRAQQEELRVANEELADQAERLAASEEALRVSNEELEENVDQLNRQKVTLERTRGNIERKAVELARASQYKSEFLANMSHELRTPLNSLLLLSQSLAQNQEGNLTSEQVESARIIYGGGRDLLNLINEILDLSRIEAGRIVLKPAPVQVGVLAEAKGLSLEVRQVPGTPSRISSDLQRVQQVVRNLVANAVKFTETGGVSVTFGPPAPGTDLSRSGLSSDHCLAIAVKDTGIGIAPEHQELIFEAFRQADSGTARKYGGTGLGLSIVREFTRLLGGEIQLQSGPGQGSTFVLYLPLPLALAAGAPTAPVAPERVGPAETSPAQDDRDALTPDDRVILAIEDDAGFAKVLRDVCHQRRFKFLAASTGEAGLELAGRFLPTGIILDIVLPGMDGWSVLAALKDNPRTRHIPVHIMSVEDTPTMSPGTEVVGFATKPLDAERLERAFDSLEETATHSGKRILVVEDDEKVRSDVKRLLGGGPVEVVEAETGEQALEALRSRHYDCVVLDLGLPDMDGAELLAQIEREIAQPPLVVVNTARELTHAEEVRLREHARSIVIEDVCSRARLLDEVSLFLHPVVADTPATGRRVLELHQADATLKGRKVLVVDDDMRTLFAVSRLLSDERARTGRAPAPYRSRAQSPLHFWLHR